MGEGFILRFPDMHPIGSGIPAVASFSDAYYRFIE
jgi:hypothetical protein